MTKTLVGPKTMSAELVRLFCRSKVTVHRCGNSHVKKRSVEFTNRPERETLRPTSLCDYRVPNIEIRMIDYRSYYDVMDAKIKNQLTEKSIIQKTIHRRSSSVYFAGLQESYNT